jgi:hypothetical protein
MKEVFFMLKYNINIYYVYLYYILAFSTQWDISLEKYFLFASEHSSSHISNTAYKSCIHWDLGINYFFAVHIALFR